MIGNGKEVHFVICSYTLEMSCSSFYENVSPLLSKPSFAVVLIFTLLLTLKLLLSCGKKHKNPLRRKGKSRYQNASLTVEASLAFPVFFFSAFYLIQMFAVLRGELALAQAGIASARDAAAFAYAAERLEDGQSVAAEKLFEVFDKKLVRDATFTAVFYARREDEVLERGGVAQELGGMWVDTNRVGSKVQLKIYYRVKPENPFFKRQGYYCQRLVYREWTGEGTLLKQQKPAEEEKKEVMVYLAENASVYHVDRNCTYINIKVSGVLSSGIGDLRNAGGAKYYPCEFCEPVLVAGKMVFYTQYGTRYHDCSTCSAIERNPRECSLEEAQKTLRACKKCGGAAKEEGGT